MVIFRENSEDIYAGIEFEAESDKAKKLIKFLQDEMGVKKIRFPNTSGIGIKPVSREGTERLVRKAIQYAIDNDKPSLTIVHKGNIMKFTEGGFRDWAYGLAQKEFGAQPIDGGPWCSFKNPKTGKDIIVKDVIADAFLQQILLRPAEYSVIATLNLNGDYVSDALAAQVGGIGIAPGANLSDTVAMFEATHGTAPKYAGKDYVNPGSEILSAEMMLRHMGWTKAADLIISSMEKSIKSKKVTYDFARLMPGVHAGQLLGLRPGDDRQHVSRPSQQKAAPGRLFCWAARPLFGHEVRLPGGMELRSAHLGMAGLPFSGLGGDGLGLAGRCLGLDVLRQLALRPFGDIEGHARTLLERLEAFHGNGREMREHIRAATVGLDEPESLCVVEPLDRTSRHSLAPCFPS